MFVEGSGKFGYKIKGKNVGYMVSIFDGVVIVVFKFLVSLDIMLMIDGMIFLSFKVGVVVAFEEFYIKFCWGGIICIGFEVIIK